MPAKDYTPIRWPPRGLILILLAVTGTNGFAGGGPENVLLVINANSNRSKEVGNHYARLRNLPAPNVLHLEYEGGLEQETGAVFREQILGPVVEAINRRGLAVQIDTVAYSCDFPWRIVLKADYPKDLKLPKPYAPIASLTGATYLYSLVLAKSPVAVTLDSNWYAAPRDQRNAKKCLALGDIKTRSFRSRYSWLEDGSRSKNPKQGRRYLMSSMLGVATGRGNTVPEILECLRRASYADASPPTGVFCFMRNSDVRSATRHECFQGAVDALRAIGAEAEVRTGVIPYDDTLVAGLTAGRDELRLRDSAMRIQPGAFCEHLTSAGGLLFKTGYQTPLTDLIRAGATASCGAVEEPYALQAKFPTPALQVHYRRGCSMAEAYYQSVAGPYQLLLVGDPLCQPWADRPTLSIEGWPQKRDLIEQALLSSGGSQGSQEKPPALDSSKEGEQPILTITPRVETGKAAGLWELYVDGLLRLRLPSGVQGKLVREMLKPGWRELRCVGVGRDALEAQTESVTWFKVPATEEKTDDPPSVGDTGEPVRMRALNSPVKIDEDLRMSVFAFGAGRIEVRHHSRVVAELQGPDGEIRIPAQKLGRGPVRLQAYCEGSTRPSQAIWVGVE